MALSELEIGQIESRIGPIGADPVSDSDRLEKAILRLGTPALAALEVMKYRYAEMVSTPASVSASGDGAVNHSANLAPMKAMLSGLLIEVEGSDETPTDEGLALIASTAGMIRSVGEVSTFPVTATNVRP